MNIIFAVIGLILGFGGVYMLPRAKTQSVSEIDKEKIKEAEHEAAQMREQTQKMIQHSQKLLESEEKDLEESLNRLEESVKQKEEILARREGRNQSLEQSLKDVKKNIDAIKEQIQGMNSQMIEHLAKASKTTPESAKKEILNEFEELITSNKDARNKAYLDERAEEAVREAKAILIPIIQRMGTESSVDKNSTSVEVKSDKFKGLLIGKGGSNIAYLESLLPIAVIFNLDPSTIHVGGVNLLRRNIAKRAIEKLQKLASKTGKVDHEMIKAAVDESEKEVMTICDQKGKAALKQLELNPEALNPEMVNYVGRMYFRTSFGQNILGHSMEMAYLARLIAEQIGADVNVAMQAAFFHDIGKAIDHDIGGAHDDVSKEILEKHNYDPRIVHAAYAHHDKVPCLAPEDFIVKAVDAISAVRPGARQESVTNYFERIKQLEDTVKAFDGVRKVFAMSAGREVRGMVDERQVQDDTMEDLAESIATRISEDLSFPGIIKVNLIRRTIATDHARERKA